MRKAIAILAVLARLYSPFRFALIIWDEADHVSAEKLGAKISAGELARKSKITNIAAPGKFYRRPFCSVEKNFTPAADVTPCPAPQIALIALYLSALLSSEPLYSHLRSPPLA